MPYKDIEVGKQKKREYYQRTKDIRKQWADNNRDKIRKGDTRRRVRRKQEMVELFGNKCSDCNGVFPLPCYDFHHLDPTKKDFNPCSGLTKRKDDLIEELKKCILLCSNCHRIRHFTYETS